MKHFLLLSLILVLGGCGSTWSSSSVKDPQTGALVQPSQMAAKEVKNPEDVTLTEGDITNKKYEVLGDIEVTVNKSTIFHQDPTQEMVDQKLKEKAAKMGADAVILVRHGTLGVSMMSWGSLDGKGRAVKFVK